MIASDMGSLPPESRAFPHIATLAEDFSQKLEAVRGFLADGLPSGDDCALVIPRSCRSRWERALAGLGLAGDPPPGNAGVELITAQEWVPPRGLNSLRMTRRLWDRIEGATSSSRDFRIAIDMAWTLEAGVDAAQVCHWEATCEHLMTPDAHAYMLCVYDLSELPVQMVHAGLRTHRLIDAGPGPEPNPFFEGPAILEHEPARNPCSEDASLVNGMLARFRPAA